MSRCSQCRVESTYLFSQLQFFFFFWSYDNENCHENCNHLLLKMTGENSLGLGDNTESQPGGQVRGDQMQRQRGWRRVRSPGLGEGH